MNHLPPCARPLSRYFKLTEAERVTQKCRQKENYARNRDAIRKRNYQRALDAGKIRCPKPATLAKYDLLHEFVQPASAEIKNVE